MSLGVGMAIRFVDDRAVSLPKCRNDVVVRDDDGRFSAPTLDAVSVHGGLVNMQGGCSPTLLVYHRAPALASRRPIINRACAKCFATFREGTPALFEKYCV